MASSINASTSGAGGVITTADNTGILNLQTAGTTAVTVNASQNVGIGTTSPAAKIESQITSTSTPSLRLRYNGSSYYFDASMDINGNTVFMTPAANGVTSGNFLFGAGGSERMRITSAGEVLIGKTTGALTSNGWALYPDEGSNYCFDMGGATNECFNYNNTGTGTYDVAFRYQATVKGYIRVNSTNTTYSTTSDYRLKENVKPMTGALAIVSQLKPVTYDWIENKISGQGFIAHELQEVIPNAVVGGKDSVDSIGNPQYQQIDSSILVATLTAALQELSAKNDALTARIEALENK